MGSSESAESTTRRVVLSAAAAGAALAPRLAAPPPAKALLSLPTRLKNRYFLCRHGESTVDVAGTVQSNPSFKYDVAFGLTSAGRDQMLAAGEFAEDVLGFTQGFIYTSNFQRASQSAEVLRQALGLLISDVRVTYRNLDPRLMGAFDGRSAAEVLPAVRAADDGDPMSYPPPAPDSMAPRLSTESLMDIYRRALEVITRYEAIYPGIDIALVSHSDWLEVCQAMLCGVDLRDMHSTVPAFELGEVRRVDASEPGVVRVLSAAGESEFQYAIPLSRQEALARCNRGDVSACDAPPPDFYELKCRDPARWRDIDCASRFPDGVPPARRGDARAMRVR